MILANHSTAQNRLVHLSESQVTGLRKSGSNIEPLFNEPWMQFQTVTSGFFLLDEKTAGNIPSDYSSPVLNFKLDALSFNDSAFSSQWNFKAIGYDPALFDSDELGPILVGVLDTGIDPEHKDLSSSLWKNPGEASAPDGIDDDRNGLTDDIYGFNFIFTRTSNLPIDDQGHGTSVAGIIAAAQNNSVGIAGLAPNAKIMSLKAFDNTGNGTEIDIAKCLLYAWYQKADIVNMSFGVSNEKSLLIETICDAMEKDGIILIASSGNSGGYDRHYPSGYESVISVGASTEYGDRAVFSMFGNRLDFLAPGVGIPTTAFGNKYRSFSGTSAAAPNATGVAAILKGLKPDITPSVLRNLLQETAVRTTDNGFSAQSGGGVINLSHAIYKLENRYEIRITSPEIDGWWKSDTLSIKASTLSPNFQSWKLYWKSGLGYPEEWNLISSGTERLLDKEAGVLIWSQLNKLIGLQDSVISVRLSVLNQNGTQIEDRRTIFRYKKPLELSFSWIDKALDRDNWSVWGEAEATHPVMLSVSATNGASRVTGSNQSWRYTGFASVQIPVPGFWKVSLTAEDLSGDKKVVEKWIEIPELPTERQELDSIQISSLPESFLLSKSIDWNRDGTNDLVLSKSSPESEYGNLYFYSGKNLIVAQDSITQKLVPKDFISFNGKNWLLGIALGNSFLFSSSSDSLPPVSQTWQNQNEEECWGSQLVVKNGKMFLIWRNSKSYFVSEFNLSGTQIVRTQPLDYPGELRLSGPPNSRLVNYRKSITNPEIFIGDPAGNAIVYEWNDSDTLKVIFADPVSLYEASDYIESADLNEDGTDELIIVSHDLQIEHPVYGETFPTRWNIRVYSEINGKDSVLFDSWFLNFAGESQRKNKIGIIKKNGGNWLILGLHPDLYLLSWNKQNQRFELKNRIPNSSMSSFISSGILNGTGFDFLSNSGDHPTAWVFSAEHQPEIQSFVQTSDTTGFLKLKSSDSGIKLFVFTDGVWQFQRIANSPTDTLNLTGKVNSTRRILLSFTNEPKTTLRRQNEKQADFYPSGQINASFRNGLIELKSPQPIHFPVSAQTSLLWQSVFPDRLIQDESGKVILIRYPESLQGFWKVPEFADKNGRKLKNYPDSLMIQNETSQAEKFYITRVAIESPTSFLVYFSKAFDPSVFQLGSIPTAIGESTALNKEPVSSSAMRIKAPGRPFGSIGKGFLVDFTGLKAVTGETIETTGSQVQLESPAESAKDLVVYPNPWNMGKSSELYFGNLPARITLNIYDIRLRKIREIKKESPLGVQSWDGRDADGKIVGSGIYIYRAVEENGNVITGKIGIVR